MKENKFFGNKEFYKKVLFIAVPIMIQNGITNLVGMLDNIMVGQLGTDQMSGVSIVNQLMFVFNVCVFGAISGAGIFGAQFYGKGDQKGMQNAVRFKFYSVGIMLIASLCLFGFASEPIINLYLHDGGEVGNIAATFAAGQGYLYVMMFGLLPFALSQIYASTLRECGETIVPMVSGIVAIFVNLFFNYIFIFGHLGMPRMGANGAALATCIARFVEVGIIIVWTHRHGDKFPFMKGLYRTMKIPAELARRIFVKGLPLILNEVFWSIGVAITSQCYAFRGLTVVAALNINSTITNVFNVVFIALGSSVSIVVGQLLGAGKIEQAKREDTQLITFSVLCCAGVAVVMSFLAGIFPNIYQTELPVKEMARDMILISAAIMPFNAFTHATYFTLRSGGKTGITFLFDSVFTWVAIIPVAYCLSHLTNLPLLLVFTLVQGMDIIKGIIGFFLVRSDIWLENIVSGE